MPLDLEPVLDLAPVGESNDAAPNGLDLQPVENAAPPARELDGRSGEKPLTDLSETVPGFVNRVMEKAGRAGVAAMNWLNDPHPETWLGMKRLPDRPGRQEYGKPMVTLAEPLTPEEAAGMPAPAAGLYNAIAKGANTLTTPEMIMAGPLFQAPGAGAALRLAFGAQMGVNTPEAVERMMDPSLTPAERWEAGGTAAIMGGMAGLMLKGPGGEGKAEPKKIEAKAKLDLEPVSEFGGVLPPPSGQGGVENARPGATGEAVLGTPVPESPETLSAQLEWLKQGKRKAVLVTPGEAAPQIPAGMKAHPTDKGVFIFDPKQTTPAAIDEAVKGDRIGELLGYGIARKPEGAETAVVVRSAEGTEKQAVVTDPANAAKVIEAAKAAADPGDTIGLEPAAEVIEQRQAPSRILQQAAREMTAAREPVPKSIVDQFPAGTFALPEGYELQGDKYVFNAPAERLTPEQQAARENAQAMAELRAQKEESAGNEDPDWSVPEEPERTDRPEPGVPMPVYGERPPDILDWIEANYPGVRVTNPEDYGTYVDEATGRSKKLVSKTKGEPADKIIEEMHAQGMYRRVESEDDLLEAMNKAAEARKGWRAQQKQSLDVQGWLDRAIEATKPGTAWTGETSMGLLRLPVWLSQEVAHGALQIAKVVYTRTRDLAEAIRTAVEHVAGMGLAGFDGGEMKAWLSGTLGERQTGEKVADSTAISDPVKQAITEYLYRVRSNATDEAIAADIVGKMGLDTAEQIVRNPPIGMAQATVSKLIGEITRTLARQEQGLRTAGDVGRADAIAQRQAQLWNDMLPKITEMAQGLQALTDIVDMSPDAQVARLKLKLDREAGLKLDAQRPEIEQIKAALEQGRQEGVEGVRQDPEVNAAARKAVDAAVAENPEVKNAIVMELAGPWSESPAILAHARQLVRSRVDEMMTTERPPAKKLTPAAVYARELMDDLARRAANIFAMHLQGAEPEVGIVEKFKRDLGLSEPKAKEMAASLQKEWDKQLKEAQAKLPKRIANARATRERNAGESPNSPTAAVDARIRKELDGMNTKLGTVLRQEAERRDQTGEHVAERVVQASGLQGEAADTLRTILKNRWDTIVTEAQRRTLERLQRQSGVKVTPRLKSAFEKLIELERLGALTSEQFYDVVRRALKLPELNAKDAAELRRLAQAAQREPEGYLRQQAAANVMKLTERLSGNARLRDVPMAIFYANILSGLTTPAKIVFENMNLLASSTVASLLTRPRDLMHPVEFMSTLAKAYGRGLKKGAAQAAGTLKTGVVSGLWADARPPTVLEMKPFGERLEPLNFWKYFIRVISTAHETTFKPGWEMRQTMIARDVARREGLTGKDLAQRTADLLANTKEHITGARAQAIAELQGTGELNAIDLRRRTGEIIEQQREANMPGSTETAREYALRMAYLNEPYGFLGLLTRGLRSVLENARRQYPVFGTGVKTQIPFTTIIANILNEKLNWTPWGLARGIMAKRTGEIYGRPALPGEHAELYAKAMVGTAALGALYYLLGDRIHGNGPSDPNKRKQLQAAGWVPHSIQVGDKFVSYMNTPAAMGLAVIGNLNDWHRYGKGDEATAASRATFALKATGNAIISQGMLDSVRRIFEAIGSESTAVGADKLEKVMARTASSFVVPNLVQQLDRIWDPTMYDQTGIEALVKSQIPFVRRDNKPVLTVLGDPVKAGPFHTWAGQITDDPLLRTLAEKQAWVPEPSRNQLIGDRRRGPDYSRSLTPDEFYEFIAMSGPEIRRRLSENLDKITDMDPDQARKFVAQIAEQEHAKAKKTFE